MAHRESSSLSYLFSSQLAPGAPLCTPQTHKRALISKTPEGFPRFVVLEFDQSQKAFCPRIYLMLDSAERARSPC